jgi:iron complex transport system ATP-binding protein
MLEVENLSFSYESEKVVFSDISFRLHPGNIFTILGPNGTGKSTLIKCLVGILPPDAGTMRLSGDMITDVSPIDQAKMMAYVPQTHHIIFPFSVLDYVLMGRSPHLTVFGQPGSSDYILAMKALRQVGMVHLIDRCISEISGGELQLVSIARALAQTPSVLILDEPTSHLDFGNQFRILSIIEQLAKDGLSVIMSSHFPDHAFLISHTVAVMQGGRFIGIGSSDEVITRDLMYQAYGVEVAICDVSECGRTVCLPVKNFHQKQDIPAIPVGISY